MKQLRPLPLILGLFCASAALATPAPSPYANGVSGAELQDLVRNTLSNHGVTGEARISAARGYPACAQAPVIAPMTPGDWSNLRVTCEGKRPWRRQIRSTAPKQSPEIRRPDPNQIAQGPMVVTLNKPLKAGTVITQADVSLSPAPQSASNGTYTDPAQLIGKRVSKNLSKGRAIQARHLKQSWMVPKEMPVAILYQSGSMNITAPGISLKNGQLGEMIEVRNLSSGKVILGQIAGPQKIVVRAKTH